jgi:hypothetical protein
MQSSGAGTGHAPSLSKAGVMPQVAGRAKAIAVRGQKGLKGSHVRRRGRKGVIASDRLGACSTVGGNPY